MSKLPTLYAQYMERVELYARKLLEQQFSDGQDLWSIQQELLKLQVELQEAAATARATQKEVRARIAERAKAKGANWKSDLQELQAELRQTESAIGVYEWVHLISKRLGDAWAWSLLKGDEHKIEPLTRNQRVPATSSGYALTGMLAIAEVLSNNGAGFPVMHDMTDCLRIGDITFVAPDRDPLTVEVKTHLEGRDGDRMELSVAVHAIAELERWQDINSRIAVRTHDQNDGITPKEVSILRGDERLQRQLQRMHDAKAWQAATATDFVKLRTQNGIAVQSTFSGKAHHWDAMREVVTRAKEKGFASQEVDGALVYTAIYSDEPLIWPDHGIDQSVFAAAQGQTITAAVASSSIWFPDDPTQNALWFDTSWSDFTDRRYVHLYPLFLWPIAPDLVMDMMWGRLWVVVYANLGKIAAALRAVGLDARLPTDDADFQQHFLGISGIRTLADGRQISFRLHNMQYYATKMLRECLSLDAFAHMMRDIAEAKQDEMATQLDSLRSETGDT